MQHVSDGYREAMQLPIRNRGYIRVLLAAFNPETQNNAFFDDLSSTPTLWYCDPLNLFQGRPSEQHYATLEERWTKVDGTMYFAPASLGNNWQTIETSAIITQNVVSSGTVAVTYPADPDLTDITIDFDGRSPSRLELVLSNGRAFITHNPSNSRRISIHSENFRNTTGFTFTAYLSSTYNSRLRVNAIYLGKVFEFSNDQVIDSRVTSHASPLAEDCPTIDAMVKVADYDNFLNPDNPDAAVYFFKPGQMMYVSYGYELETLPQILGRIYTSSVEWVPGWKLELDRWEYQNNQATLFGVDMLRHLTDLYRDGQYMTGRYYNGMVNEVQLAAGLNNQRVDMTDWWPSGRSANGSIVPVVPYREAFQMIANLTTTTLLLNRIGQLIFRNWPRLANAVPEDYTIRTDDLYAYAKMQYPPVVKDVTIESGQWWTKAGTVEAVNQQLTLQQGGSTVISWNTPMYVTSITLDGTSATLAGLRQDYLNPYSVKLTALSAVAGTLIVSGQELEWLNTEAYYPVAPTGNSERWTKPTGSILAIIRTAEANALVFDGYCNTPTYTAETRGFPELDAGDIIYLEDRFRPNLRIWLTDVSIRFNGAFRGSFTGRWVGDDSGLGNS